MKTVACLLLAGTLFLSVPEAESIFWGVIRILGAFGWIVIAFRD